MPRRNYATDLRIKVNLMKKNPTELYLMVARNEFSLEDFARIFLMAQEDWELAESAEFFAKLILQDEAAATQEAFRIMSEEDEIVNLMIEDEIATDDEVRYWKEMEEIWRLEEQTKREILEYMESEDFV